MPTFAEYRRPTGRALNDLGIYQVTSATNSSVTSVALADSTTDASEHRYDGAYVYVASGAAVGNQRRVKPGGFTTTSGLLALELTWNAPIALDFIDITRLFPVVEQVPNEDPSYRNLINRALAKLWAPDRISLTFSSSSTASLLSYPWLDRPERLVRVLEPAPVSGFPDVPCGWRDPQLILNGPSPVLQLNRPYTGTLTLEVRRPGDTLISGAESTVGLSSESQTALPAVEDVVLGALVEAYAVLMNRSPGRPGGGNYADKYADARERFESLAYFDRTQRARQAPQPAPEAA